MRIDIKDVCVVCVCHIHFGFLLPQYCSNAFLNHRLGPCLFMSLKRKSAPSLARASARSLPTVPTCAEGVLIIVFWVTDRLGGIGLGPITTFGGFLIFQRRRRKIFRKMVKISDFFIKKCCFST